jgi:alpha-L-fucosidase
VLTGGTATVCQTEQGIEIRVPPSDRQELDTIVALTLDGPAAELGTIRLPSASLACGQKATASNVFQNSPEFAPERAFDDDPATRWGCDWGTHAAWLEVDLGQSRTFDRVYISEPYGRVRKFELQIQEGGQWRTFHHGTTIGEEFSATFAPVTGQHVRLNLLETTEGPSIWEFQLFAPAS